MKRVALIKRRMELGFSVEAMAKRAGLSSATIINVENGAVPYPRNVARLADSYKMTPRELVAILYDGVGEEK